MNDYINRQTAVAELRKNMNYMRAFGADRSIAVINEVPAADVQPVVRCKDCKHWYQAICLKRNGGDGGNWYCADGEIEEDEDIYIVFEESKHSSSPSICSVFKNKSSAIQEVEYLRERYPSEEFYIVDQWLKR